MTDQETVAVQLESMMSHGIFDAETIADTFRRQGWQFVYDAQQDSETGGAYFVRTPGRHEGYVNWFSKDTINQLTTNAAFFVEETAPKRMLLAWIFADQMGRLILGRGFDEDGNGNTLPPGKAFEGAYLAFKYGNPLPTTVSVPQVQPEPTLDAVLTSGMEGELEESDTPSFAEVVGEPVSLCYHESQQLVSDTPPHEVATHRRCNVCGELYPISEPIEDWLPAKLNPPQEG
jgi:hypothetical protein